MDIRAFFDGKKKAKLLSDHPSDTQKANPALQSAPTSSCPGSVRQA
jgi:hypothetical protein